MSRTVEFHEATITLSVKAIEDGRTVDVQRYQVAVLMDTDAEWAQAVAMARGQVAALKEASDGNLGNAETD